jgi:class 3 adenylate cyclase/tetratricopeptide (TPR) repeat protein
MSPPISWYAEARPGRTFPRAQSAHTLHVVAQCPACGEHNPERARFCLNCATPLSQLASAGGEERKVVTVLFCDLVGFTASSDRADPEDIRARIRPYHARLRTEIERYGGTVEKFIGDAVMAVFGAPFSHEDDPERAVRAGLRLVGAIGELNEEDAGLDLQVRVGIESGEAVVALGISADRGEGMVTGDVVNTASRLQGVAPVNGVAVGQGTHSATKDIFDYLNLEPVTLKGKADPVPLWHARAARGRFGTDLTRGLTTPLVGREPEYSLLTGAFERAVRDASVQLVTVVGEPGVGKSRLVAEMFSFIDSRPELIRWRQGRSLPYGDAITFWALGEIVKAEAGILETDAPEVAESKIDVVVADTHPDAPWLRQRLRPLVGLEAPQAGREENFAAWRAFLESLAENAPSVFVFEDLHWADDALLAFIEHVADYAAGVAMVLVGTARPELLERVPGFAQGARNSARVNLSPLSESETARLIGNLLESAVLPIEVQDAILDRSGGNPLYAEEFVRLLKDRAILTKNQGSWSIDRGAEVPLPSGLQGLIAARLDILPPERKRLLQDAAVVGKVFWSEAVASMGGQDPALVREALHQLSRNDLVRPTRVSSMEGQAEYSFCHTLIRDVCYSQIPRAHRAERHRRAAAWVEGEASDRVGDLAEVLAAHYSTALDLAMASKDPSTADLKAKAVWYLMLAGERAMGIDVEAAERHYARALDMMGEGNSHRSVVLAHHGEALLQRGQYPEAARALEEAIEAFRNHGDVRAMALAMGWLQIALVRMGDPPSQALSAEALAVLEPLGPSPELVKALNEEAAWSYLMGKNLSAIEFADRAISIAGDVGLAVPARSLMARGGARALLGDAGGVQDVREALKAAEDQGLGRDTALAHNILAYVLLPIEGPRSSIGVLREGVAFAHRRGIEEQNAMLSTSILDSLLDLGSYSEVTALAGELLPELEKANDVWNLILARSTLALAFVRSGRYAEAAPLAEWATHEARETGEVQHLARSMPVLAGVRLALGDRASAAALLSELEAILHVREEFEYVRNLPDAVGTALAAGDQGLASRMAGHVAATWAFHEHALEMVEALLAEHRGDLAGASALFRDAATRWERFEMPWQQAQALLGCGRCLLAMRLLPEANGPLREALEMFATLGAGPALSETQTLLGELSL